MRFLQRFSSIIRYTALPPAQKQLTFYSEGKNYWVHLEGMVRRLLEGSDIELNYVSSDPQDPGLHLDHPRLHTFEIGEGFLRNWFFENLQTQVMVMTMPDLDQFQIKRSKFPVHYVYVQHSLVSLHMIYRERAFDAFDTVFCSGPHHVVEMQAIQQAHGINGQELVEHGYGRLDAIRAAAAGGNPAGPEDSLQVVVAPSWGPHGLIESGLGLTLVDRLLDQGHRVTLRPHPQTNRLNAPQVAEITAKHRANSRFDFEANVATQASLHASDLMISDWSGAALDYAYGLNKPVLFIDVPRKVNNPSYETLGLIPFEVSVREDIGAIVDPAEIADLDLRKVMAEMSARPITPQVFNVDHSDAVGAEYINALVGTGN